MRLISSARTIESTGPTTIGVLERYRKALSPQGAPEGPSAVIVGNGNPNMNGFLSGPLAKFAMVQHPHGSGGFGSPAYLVGANQRLKFRYDTQPKTIVGSPSQDTTVTFPQFGVRPVSGTVQLSYSVGGTSGGLLDNRYIRGGRPAAQVPYRDKTILTVPTAHGGSTFWRANSPLPPFTRYIRASDFIYHPEEAYEPTHTFEGAELVNPPDGIYAPAGWTDEWWREGNRVAQLGDDSE
jgi:hypothetical protein